jgi:hypothetical protein
MDAAPEINPRFAGYQARTLRKIAVLELRRIN